MSGEAIAVVVPSLLSPVLLSSVSLLLSSLMPPRTKLTARKTGRPLQPRPPPSRFYVDIDDDEPMPPVPSASSSSPPSSAAPLSIPPLEHPSPTRPLSSLSSSPASFAFPSSSPLPLSGGAGEQQDSDSPELPTLIPPPSPQHSPSPPAVSDDPSNRPHSSTRSFSEHRGDHSSLSSSVPSSSSDAAQTPPPSQLPPSLSSPSLSLPLSPSGPPPPLDPPSSIDPTDAQLSEEGLSPDWSEWTAVTSPPSQSYDGYIDAVSRSLPSSILSKLKKCSPYPNSDHEDPFPAISSPTFTPPFTLYRRVDAVYGLIQHKLIASRHIREKEVLGFVGGHLQTVEECKKEGVDKGHPSHLLIDRGYLHKYYEYKGAESVVLSMKRYHHALQHIRDPSLFLSDAEEVRPELEAYNVNIDVAFDSGPSYARHHRVCVAPYRGGEGVIRLPLSGEVVQ